MPNYSKAFEWLKLISITGGAQMLIQGIGLISGILIIRLLPTSEYALYTLSNAMLGTMSVLSDGGISAGVMSQGGRVWKDRQKLGVVLVTGLQLRKRFGIVSLLISMPILFYLLIHHGASWIIALLIILALIPAFFAGLSDNLLETVSKLHQDVGRLQKNQIAAGLGRFVIITASILLFPWTFVTILGNGIPRLWANIKLRKMVAKFADFQQTSDPVVKREILTIVKRTLPGAVYFCISGQVTIWLVSIFGNTSSIANIGALSRLTTILTVFTTVFATLVVPRFARLQNDKKLLSIRFIQIQISLLIICCFITGLVTMFPEQVLWILGKGYVRLKTEVIMITVSSCLAMLAGVTYSVMTSRGWILNPIIHIITNVSFQVILACIMDLSKVQNVLKFAIVDFFIAYILLLMYFIYKINCLKIKAPFKYGLVIL